MAYLAQQLFPVYLGGGGGYHPPGSRLSDQTRSRKSNHQVAILDFRLPVFVAQHSDYSDYFHLVAGPQKYGYSHWNFIPISSTS